MTAKVLIYSPQGKHSFSKTVAEEYMINLESNKILITGASGSLGKQLIYELVQQGIKPIAQVRVGSDTTYIDSLGLEKRTSDLCHTDQLPTLVEGIDAIIHTAAWVNFRRDQLAGFSEINTTASVELFKAAEQAGVKRLVHVSTVSAVGGLKKNGRRDLKSALVNEDSPFNLAHLRIPYIMTKRAAEIGLADVARNSKVELVTVNPSIMIAPSRTGDDRGKAMKTFGKLLLPKLSVRLNLVDIRDVAPGVIAALQKGRPGHRYILAGDNISERALVLAVSAALGRAPHLVRVSRKFLKVVSRGWLFLCRLLGRSKISFYPDLVRMLDLDWVYSSKKAHNELGYGYRSVLISISDLMTNNFVGTHLKPKRDK